MTLIFGILVILFFVVSTGVVIQTSFAQTANNDVTITEQTILSEDLANNPVAQDILKKIEQTKK